MARADLKVLDEIQRRLLWLATLMIDVANHRRPNVDGLKVGGHQASSASMVTLMTALYMHHLNGDDFVAVKPHGSPVLHAINYLMGNLNEEQMTQLRQFGGLQAYPSRTKDPDRIDFSTGSVGLGPAATLFAAGVREYVEAHFGLRPKSRFFAVLGDAELDEGNIWEAVHDPASNALGAVTWLIDFNRQSLDRIVPDMRISPWHAAFAAHGWQVIEVKYGNRLREFVAERQVPELLEWINEMPNERYQSLFGLNASGRRESFLQGAPQSVREALSDLDDDRVGELVTDLGGHDLGSVLDALAQAEADTERPTAIFAYTHKGWGLPIQGSARNHAAVLSTEQVGQLRRQLGIPEDQEWARFPSDSPAGRLLAERARHLVRTPLTPGERPSVPITTNPRVSRPQSTQEGFGRILVDLSRDESVGPYLVTTSPDVATSTNLAGWINRVGVFAEKERQTWSDDPMLRWVEKPSGQHIELGISEMNFFMLLGQLGLAEHYSGQKLLPVGALYDPFVARGLDALVYGVYSGSSFVFAGTPSGVTLAPEGGAHQSSITASIGTEMPGLTYHEPAYVQALDWLLCDALERVANSDDQHSQSAYFRLTTRSISQEPFQRVRDRSGAERLRENVLRGAYLLQESSISEGKPAVILAACGSVIPDVLLAADELESEGVACEVVDVCSPGRLYRAWRDEIRNGIGSARPPGKIPALECFRPGVPIVTIQDASSHQLAWLGSAKGVPSASLGVDDFGQSGTIQDLYQEHQLNSGAVVNAALGVIS